MENLLTLPVVILRTMACLEESQSAGSEDTVDCPTFALLNATPTLDMDVEMNGTRGVGDNHYWALALSVVPLLTVVGNGMVILAVFRNKALHSAINAFIAGLATADLLVGLVVMPFAVYTEVNGGLWELGWLLCDLYCAADVVCSTASILTLTVISFDRYRAVKAPIEYSKQAKNLSRVGAFLSGVWMISLGTASPMTMGLNVPPDGQARSETECRFYNADYIIWSSVVSFLLPLIALLVLYFQILMAIRDRARANRERKAHVAAAAERRKSRAASMARIKRDSQAAASLPRQSNASLAKPAAPQPPLHQPPARPAPSDPETERLVAQPRNGSVVSATAAREPSSVTEALAEERAEGLAAKTLALPDDEALSRRSSAQLTTARLSVSAVSESDARRSSLLSSAGRELETFTPTCMDEISYIDERSSLGSVGLIGGGHKTPPPLIRLHSVLSSPERSSKRTTSSPIRSNTQPSIATHAVASHRDTVSLSGLGELSEMVSELVDSETGDIIRPESTADQVSLLPHDDQTEPLDSLGHDPPPPSEPPLIDDLSQPPVRPHPEPTQPQADLISREPEAVSEEPSPELPRRSSGRADETIDEADEDEDDEEAEEEDEFLGCSVEPSPLLQHRLRATSNTDSGGVSLLGVPGAGEAGSSGVSLTSVGTETSLGITSSTSTVSKDLRLPPHLAAAPSKLANAKTSISNMWKSGTSSLLAAPSGGEGSGRGGLRIGRKNSARKKAAKAARKERKATKTLAVVVGVFLCCWVPFFSLNIVNAICLKLQVEQCQVSFLPFFLTSWLGYMNSAMNPLIYTVFNRDFRQAFRQLICPWVREQRF